jgi:uncharacterized membrane protein
VRFSFLFKTLLWLAVFLILRVTYAVVSNYRDYFPPNFDADFLQSHRHAFHGLYRIAFYAHIITSPIVLLMSLALLNDRLRKRYLTLHRYLGRVHIVLLLLFALPSGGVMALRSFAGWPAGVSFVILTVITAICAILGVYHARHRRFDRHRRWMLRTFALLVSAVVLRLISNVPVYLGMDNPELAYTITSWCSWLLPLAICELYLRLRIR